MMNRYTSILLLAVMGCVVSGLDAIKPKKTESYFTAGNVLAALGLAGAGAGAYYAYDPVDAKQKFEDAKKKLSEARDYVKNADSRTLGYGVLGAAAAGWLAYKLFFQGQDELAVETPDSEDFLNNLGRVNPKLKPDSLGNLPETAEFPGWLQAAGTLFWEVFGNIRDSEQRRKMIKPYIQVATRDPHQLLRDTRLIDRLDLEQKFMLLQIFVAYTNDRVMQAGQLLSDSLGTWHPELTEALAAEDADKVADILGDLENMTGKRAISRKQVKFIEGELEIIKDCKEKQENFREIYKLDVTSAQAKPTRRNVHRTTMPVKSKQQPRMMARARR